MKPLVLIVGRLAKETTGVRGKPFAAGRRYFHAIVEAGGTPLMLPPITSLVDDTRDLMRRIDGLVLHGGGDIDPRLYGQKATAEELYGIVPEHDEVELAVVRAALELDRRVDTREGCAGEHGLHRFTTAQPDRLTGCEIGGDHHQWHRCVLEESVAELLPQETPARLVVEE